MARFDPVLLLFQVSLSQSIFSDHIRLHEQDETGGFLLPGQEKGQESMREGHETGEVDRDLFMKEVQIKLVCVGEIEGTLDAGVEKDAVNIGGRFHHTG